MKLLIRKHRILIILLLLPFLFACSKSERTVPEPTISVNILSPTEGAAVAKGDTLHIIADIISPVELHGYKWRIVDNLGTEIAAYDAHTHNKNLTINDYWINNLNVPTNAILEIKAEVDHNGYEKMTTVNFVCNN